ncbi:GmrSD restriction endonuclease domain-containing protein [Mesorhizobium sp. LjRoot246]|uniref:GmrSD restriction endonuclease domain-containing protein n=1 Tax=Mesorhizobium sp. LjRoot246 TaxID=3342294 RepID=UPI003ECD5D6A
MKIKTILDKIDEKQLFVPAFQREYRWQRPDALKLVESLLKEYPTGTLLVWETNKPPELKGPHKYHENQGAVKILLDGQQRVTTLYMLARSAPPPYYNSTDILVDPSGMWIDLLNLKPDYGSDAKRSGDPRWQRLTDILQNKVNAWGLFPEFEKTGFPLDQQTQQIIGQNIDSVKRILDYDIPEQTIPIRATVGEAIEIFYIVNKAGITLTDAELALAQISGYWPQAREELKRKLDTLRESGFEFSLDVLIYIILACLYSSGTELHKLHPSDNKDRLIDAWSKLSGETIDYAINLLRGHAFVDHSSELSTPYVMVPLISWLYKAKVKPSESSINRMVRWFYLSQARQRYSVGVLQKLETELKIIEKVDDPWDNLVALIAEKRPLAITPEELERIPIQNPIFTVMRWVFKARDAVCLTVGTKLHQTMGEKYSLERDHIFPTRLLKEHGYGQSNAPKYALAQEVSNRMILTKVGNRQKSDAEPTAYLTSAMETFPNALARQCIPEDKTLWDIARFEDFLTARRNLIAGAINAHLDSLGAKSTVAVEATIDELIESGESAELEFKQTFRWDVERGQPSKKMEEVIAKAVAAFTNSDGGTLLIGVHDESGAVGLEPDYAVAGGDKDGFELALTNSLQNQFGTAFKAGKIKVSFPIATGVEICRMDVAKSHMLMPINVTTKEGHKVSKIYVRSGNSSQELPAHEVQSYIAQRNG